MKTQEEKTMAVAPLGIAELSTANIQLMKKQADELKIDMATGNGYPEVRAAHIQAKDLDLKFGNEWTN